MALTQVDVNGILGALPFLVDLVKTIHAKANPGAPPLDDAGALAILLSVANATIAKDEAYKAGHPV